MSEDRVFICRILSTPRHTHTPGALHVVAGRVANAGPPPPGTRGVRLDGWVIPGLVDLQVNGLGDRSLLGASPAEVRALAADLVSEGVTSFCPTIVSAPERVRLETLDAVAEARHATGPGARILGVHLEGPWISPVRAGAHDPEALEPPSEAAVRRSLERHPGLVRIVTLAPELRGGLDLVRTVARAGAVPSIGHSDASAAETLRAIEAGVRLATHLFNAMRPFHHRDPGVAGAVLADQRVVAGLIGDGVHVHPLAVLLAFRAKGAGRVALVSDLVARTSGERSSGMPRTTEGVLAGALAGLARGLAVARKAGVDPFGAVQAATLTPATLLGIGTGRLEPGAPADFVVLDDDLRPTATYLGGRLAWSR